MGVLRILVVGVALVWGSVSAGAQEGPEGALQDGLMTVERLGT